MLYIKVYMQDLVLSAAPLGTSNACGLCQAVAVFAPRNRQHSKAIDLAASLKSERLSR